MIKRFSILAVFAALVVFGEGCVLADLFPEQKHQVDPAMAATYFGEPTIRPGIVLQIGVTAAGTPAFDVRQYQVDSEGKILMPLVGPVKCDGLTLVGLSDKITASYKTYYHDPQVTVVYAYVPGQGMVSPWGTVTVLGEVGRPGPVDVPSTMDLRVTRALQLAGGTTQLADTTSVRVTRCDKDGKLTKTIVDLVAIGKNGLSDKDILLKAGDVVWVPMSIY